MKTVFDFSSNQFDSTDLVEFMTEVYQVKSCFRINSTFVNCPVDSDSKIPTIITNDLKLSARNSPYQVKSSLVIAENSSLTIDSGVVLNLAYRVNIVVLGKLIINNAVVTTTINS